MSASSEFYRPYEPGGLDFKSEVIEERERPTLACTREAVSAIDLVYRVQSRTLLWPHNVSDKTIDQAAEINPEINSHYTVVRIRDDKLVAESYHEVFAPQLAPVVHWLEAAQVTSNHRFKDYLRAVVKELQYGEEHHEKAVAAWLSMSEEPYVDFVGGFIDPYEDRRKRKYFAQGATGTLNPNATRTLQKFTDGQLAVWREIAPPHAPKNPKVRVRVDNTERFGGLARIMRPSANNLPCEPPLRERYGSKIVIFLPSLMDRLLNERLPLLTRVIPIDARRDWEEEDVIEAGMLLIGAHEPSHSVIRRSNDQDRFGSMYAYINEMYATVLGLAIVGMRNDIRDETKNLILAVQFATITDAYNQRETDRSRKDYLLGFATIFNTLIEDGAIAIDNEGRIRWDDHRTVYKSLAKFQAGIENLITYGNKEMAIRLRTEDGHFRNLQSLRPFRERQIVTSETIPPEFLQKSGEDPKPKRDSANLVTGS